MGLRRPYIVRTVAHWLTAISRRAHRRPFHFLITSRQLVIAVLVDMQRLQLLQLDLSAVTVTESVLRTSVSAVIFVSTYDRTTDNTSVQRHRRKRRTTTSKLATKQSHNWLGLQVSP